VSLVLACQPASKIDQRPASSVDHAKKRQAHVSHRETSLEPWSVGHAASARDLVNLARLFTPGPINRIRTVRKLAFASPELVANVLNLRAGTS
jgi:hypothetical protein